MKTHPTLLESAEGITETRHQTTQDQDAFGCMNMHLKEELAISCSPAQLL